MKRLDRSEIVFKILAYVLLTLFALACLYPFVYLLSASISIQCISIEESFFIASPARAFIATAATLLVGKLGVVTYSALS